MRGCRHEWVQTEKFTVPPNPISEFEGRVGTDFLRILRDSMFGFTAVHLECKICGDVVSRRLDGVAP